VEAKSRVKELNTEAASLKQLSERQAKGVSAGVVAQNDLERTLAELRRVQTELDGAEAEAALAAQRLEQEEGFARQGLRSVQAVESARGELELARAAVQSAVARLSQAESERARIEADRRSAEDRIRLLGGRPGGGSRITVTAPISGEVEARHVSIGQTVAAGEHLYELLNASLVWVLADVYEKDVSKVMAGQEVEISADALPNRPYRGKVAFVHNEVDPETRTVRVRIVVDNPGERLKQNMFVRVLVATEQESKTLIPASAIQTSGGLDVVFVEEAPGAYRRTVVKTLTRSGAKAVVEGVEPGQKVVADGAYQLQSMVAAR
jgi:multidrug efflux pump subunit AcrA (membrane-fusion protein)